MSFSDLKELGSEANVKALQSRVWICLDALVTWVYWDSSLVLDLKRAAIAFRFV